VSKESITDLIAKLRKLEQRERVDHREHGPECMGAPSWETRLSRDLALVVDALEAVTVPTEPEYEYRAVTKVGNHFGSFDSMPEMDKGWTAERRTVGKWEAVEPENGGTHE
jgi:hypothetical protein